MGSASPHTPQVAYQGHAGAFSDVAARALVAGAHTRGYGSFDAVAEAVAGGEVVYGVLPVENAIAGPVPRNYELLWEHPSLRICGETMLAIELCLIGTAGATEAGVREIRSHPVALEQVRRYADAHGWERAETTDTAGAVREIVALGDPAVAAIGPALAAELHGGTILARAVQDEAENYTRFFLIERGEVDAAGNRACVGIAVEDRPGSLRDALSAFADRAIDLRFLIARPDRRVPFRYRFFVELTNVDDARLAEALASIGGEQRILGRYLAIRASRRLGLLLSLSARARPIAAASPDRSCTSGSDGARNVHDAAWCGSASRANAARTRSIHGSPRYAARLPSTMTSSTSTSASSAHAAPTARALSSSAACDTASPRAARCATSRPLVPSYEGSRSRAIFGSALAAPNDSNEPGFPKTSGPSSR